VVVAVTATPIDLTPAEPEPPTLLDRLRLTEGLAELHAAINRTRTTTSTTGPEGDQ
jgi:hypothetical protein